MSKIIGNTVGTTLNPKRVAEFVDTANALKGSASGSAIRISDVSPVEHRLKVGLRSKNLFDSSQLLNASGWTETDGVYSGKINDYLIAFEDGFEMPAFLPNTQYTISLQGYATNGATPRFYVAYTDGTKNALGIYASEMTAYSYTTTAGKTVSKLYGSFGSGTNETLYLKDIRVELGTTATEYTPYLGDFSGVEVKAYGKNLLNAEEAFPQEAMQKNEDGSFTQIAEDTYGSFRVRLCARKYGAFVKSLITSYVITTAGKVSFTFIKDNTFNQLDFGHNGQTQNILCLIPVSHLPNGTYVFSANVTNVTMGSLSWRDMQIEVGEAATEYEAYKEAASYTPNADGTLEGVKSIYPVTTLLTVTDGVILEGEYNRDLNRAYGALVKAIEALGGAV